MIFLLIFSYFKSYFAHITTTTTYNYRSVIKLECRGGDYSSMYVGFLLFRLKPVHEAVVVVLSGKVCCACTSLSPKF